MKKTGFIKNGNKTMRWTMLEDNTFRVVYEIENENTPIVYHMDDDEFYNAIVFFKLYGVF